MQTEENQVCLFSWIVCMGAVLRAMHGGVKRPRAEGLLSAPLKLKTEHESPSSSSFGCRAATLSSRFSDTMSFRLSSERVEGETLLEEEENNMGDRGEFVPSSKPSSSSTLARIGDKRPLSVEAFEFVRERKSVQASSSSLLREAGLPVHFERKLLSDPTSCRDT